MVILGWGWVGWVGAITFMSTCTHTSCYVMVIFSCTCTHTSCYVMVIFCCTYTHTRHATLWWSSLALAHTRHATLWLACGCVVDLFCNGIQPLIRCLYRDLGMVRPREAINSLDWDTTPDKMSLQGLGNGETPGNPCLGVTCQKFENQTWQSVSPKQRMDQTNAKNLLFFPVHCGRDANRWQMVERPERLYSQKLSKTVASWSQHKRAPWIGKVCLGLLLAKIFGTIDTSPISRRTLQGRQSNEELLRRRIKSAASQKNTNLCQKTK